MVEGSRGAVFGRPLVEIGPTATQLRARAAAAERAVADDPSVVAGQVTIEEALRDWADGDGVEH